MSLVQILSTLRTTWRAKWNVNLHAMACDSDLPGAKDLPQPSIPVNE